MRRIFFINRNPKCGYSIHKVFFNIIPKIATILETQIYDVKKERGNIFDVTSNILGVKKISKDKNSIYHITGDVHYLTLALFKKKVVVTVHDVGRIKSVKNIKKIFYWLLRIATLRFANQIVFISEYAKEEVLSYISLPSKKISIIPDAVGDEFIYKPKEFNTIKPRILHIGTRPHKNLTLTIIALSGIDCHLRIIGQISDSDLNLLHKYNIDFSNSYNLTDDDLLNEYEKCDIINFPSTHEGFGMPIIEGQATGRLVVTSNISPMKEVAGLGACLCDPYSVQSIRDTYLKILHDEKYRNEKIRLGLENVKQYRSDIIANKYINLYNSL